MASAKNPLKMKSPMGRPEFWTEEIIDYLTKRLEEYGNRKDAYDIALFRCENNLTIDNIRTLKKKSPDFSRAYELTRLKIGSRRQEKALKGEWHAGTVHRDDWMYCEEVKSWYEYMKDKEIAANQNPAGLAELSLIESLKKEIEELKAKLNSND